MGVSRSSWRARGNLLIWYITESSASLSGTCPLCPLEGDLPGSQRHAAPGWWVLLGGNSVAPLQLSLPTICWPHVSLSAPSRFNLTSCRVAGPLVVHGASGQKLGFPKDPRHAPPGPALHAELPVAPASPANTKFPGKGGPRLERGTWVPAMAMTFWGTSRRSGAISRPCAGRSGPGLLESARRPGLPRTKGLPAPQ